LRVADFFYSWLAGLRMKPANGFAC